MGDFARKSDGRRIFTVEFKRGIVQQLVKGEKTLAEMSRELDIQETGEQTRRVDPYLFPTGWPRPAMHLLKYA